MSDFTDNVRKAFELYLLGNKKEAFNHLIAGSKYHTYLTILDAMKTEKPNLSSETKKLINDFVYNYGGSSESDKLKLRELFLRYEATEDQKEKESVITEMSTALCIYYQSEKPIHLVRKTTKADKSDKDSVKPHNYGKAVYSNAFDPEVAVQNAEASSYNIVSSLHKTLYNDINFSKLTDDVFFDFCRNARSLSDIKCESFLQKFASALNQKYKFNSNFSFEYYICNKLTLKQMEELEKMIPSLKNDENWIGKIFEKTFHYELDNEYKDLFTLEERREQLIKMYEASKDRPQSLQSSFLLEILENGMKLDIYDKKYFVEYLKNPLRQYLMNTDRVTRDIYSYNWDQYIRNIQSQDYSSGSTSIKDEKIFKTYLEQFYRDKGDIKDFGKYFDSNFFRNLVEELEFYSGKDPEATSANAQRFENLKDKVMIELLESNKEVFMKDDRVRIIAELKNTPQLYVKIYEFDRKTELSGCR